MPRQQETFSLEEAFSQIKTMMDREEWQSAHRACLEILRFDPENIKAIRIKSKIEKKVEKINKRIIKDDIDALKPLWDEKKYDELVHHLKSLKQYSHKHPRVKKELKKATELLHKQQLEEYEAAFKEEVKRIHKAVEDQKYQEAMRRAQKLRLGRTHENELKKIIADIRNKWVNSELKRQEGLLNGKKFEDILLALRHIQSIDPGSKKIEKYIKQTKKKYQRYKVEEQKDFIYQGIEKVRTLIQLKKYGKAAEAIMEILDIDPENKSARALFRKAKRKLNRSTNKDLYEQMNKAHKELKAARKANKSSFVRI